MEVRCSWLGVEFAAELADDEGLDQGVDRTSEGDDERERAEGADEFGVEPVAKGAHE